MIGKDCPNCNGKGSTPEIYRGFFKSSSIKVPCRRCYGTGKLDPNLSESLLDRAKIINGSININDLILWMQAREEALIRYYHDQLSSSNISKEIKEIIEDLTDTLFFLAKEKEASK